MAIFFPPPPPHVGGHQPHAGRDTLPPSIAAVPVNDPPFQHPGRSVVTSTITAVWQPNPWTYSFFGNAQPFQPRTLAPTRAEAPPVITMSRVIIDGIVVAWQPPPPHAYMGGRQALQPRMLPATLLHVTVNNPPISRVFNFETIYASWMQPPPLPTLPTRRPVLPFQRAYIIVIT